MDLGLKCGIEIHQQLATKKLFCNCPSDIREDAPDYEIVRRLRASAGESGETDQAALHETRKEKQFHYRGYNDTTCLVEVDEEPPHPLNMNALNVGLQVAKMMNSTILPRAQVMRKTVVDGSNTSGFQRTMLFAMGGEIKGDWGRAGVQTICLEEDAAKVVERTQAYDVYNLSRLGIPLLEIATDPDLTTPEMVQGACAHIGLLLRSTRAVRRGLGTIRQDVNISIRGGARVEIKGAQDLKMIPTLVENEMLRQKGLLDLKGKKVDLLDGQFRDVTKCFKGAKGFIGKLVEKGHVVQGFALKNKKGLLGMELYDGYRIGTELKGYAQAQGFGGIIHSDEDSKKYGVDFQEISKEFHCGDSDSWLVVVGDNHERIRLVLLTLMARVQDLQEGVISEVRKANADGSTTFLRPMPGAARMYPETDIPDVTIDASKVVVPKLLTEQYNDFAKKHGISVDLAKEAIEIPYFERIAGKNAKLAAELLIVLPKEIKKREKLEITDEVLEKTVLELLAHPDLPKDAYYTLLIDAANGKELDFDQFKQMNVSDVEKIVKEVIAQDPKAPVNALMGQAMTRLRGKADGKIVMELLRKHT